MLVLMLVMLILTGFSGSTAQGCDINNPCSNGPIVPQKANERFLKAGEEDCPAWFPQLFGHACVTTRAIGATWLKTL